MGLLARFYRSVQLGLWQQPVSGPFGTKLYGHALDGTFQMIVRNAYGDFTYDVLRAAEPDCAFLDIGANIGLYSVALGSYFKGPRVAFEPNPQTFGYLQSNLEKAGQSDVRAICAGIAAGNEPSASLNLRRFHSGAASLATEFGHIQKRISLIGPDLIQSLVPDNRPLVFKIDVEGAELGVVQCLSESGLLARCERMVIEMSLGTSDTDTLAQIRKMLTDSGLVLRDRVGSDHFGDELFTR